MWGLGSTSAYIAFRSSQTSSSWAFKRQNERRAPTILIGMSRREGVI